MALNFPDNPVVGYIYNDPTSTFSYEWDGTVWKSYTTPSSSNIKLLDNISGLFDNNTVSFPLTVDGDSVINATSKQLILSVGGVIQNPTVDFDVVGSNIVFTTAPATGLSFFGTLLGTAQTEQVSVYNKQSYTAVGVQTTFTFSTGYTVGYLDVFRNGVRLVSGSDFTASDGSTFVLSPPAQNGDDIEAVGFNVSTLTSIDGNIANLNVSVNANVVGVTTLNSRLTITSGGANITGVVTASSFVGNLTGSATYAPIAGVSTYASTSGISTYAATAGVSTYAATAGVSTTASSLNTGNTYQVQRIGIGQSAATGTAIDLAGRYAQTIISVPALDIDCGQGNYFVKSISSTSTFTFSNVPSSRAYAFTLELTTTGSPSINWPTEVRWPAGISPVLGSSKTHLFIFVTDDGGTIWRGSSLVDYTTS